MAYSFKIADLVRNSFGITDVKVYSPGSIPKDSRINYESIDAIDSDPDALKSKLGTPIIMPITFGEVRYEKQEKGRKQKYRLSKKTLPPATIISFTQKKNIIKTNIAGRDGEIKENMGLGDWIISIRGFIINDDQPGIFPEDYFHHMAEFGKVPVAIPIENKICELLGIYYIVIEDVQFDAIEGAPGVQVFSFNCVSDMPYELIKKQNTII